MNNVGPIDPSKNTKSGKELISDLFQASSQINDDEDDTDDSDEEMAEENEPENEKKKSEASSFSTIKDKEPTYNKNELFSSRKRSLQQESHQIILNLSKQTLRNVLMLVCNEAVCVL
jgi:hypothetical protein